MTLSADQALKLASEAHLASTSYFDNSIRREIEGDLRRFQGLHPAGSKYLSDAYRARSRLFRPKTRTAIRKHEAIAAEAFFSTRDVVSVEPQDDNDPVQQASAEVMKELLQHRLTKTIPWFQTLIGAYQDALTVGIVCSYQHWVYNEKRGKDEPAVRLVPVENIRFDPGADWMDPVNTSPYFIEMVPMYVKDVKARMQEGDAKSGEKKWKLLEDAQILNAVRGYSDSTRITREQGRQDPKDQAQTITAYSIVWVHKNIVDHDGEDFCFYTLGTTALLSDPVKLANRYHHGRRPYVIGNCVIETHKNYPSSPNRLGKELQAEANEIINLRNDNVKLVLNKRYFVKRNRQVDLRSLTKGVAGGVTLMTDPNGDVVTQEFNDVTASAYKEQEVLNLDYDDALGTFAGSSVQSNRKMNETVGGMELLHTDANQVSGYQLRTFVETWVEPVLRQVVLLEQAYETDETILAIAGQRASVFERFGVEAITDEILEQELTLSVSVGMGATNPQQKVNRLLTAMRAMKELLTDGVLQSHGLKFEEVAKEIFGNLGYRDGSRFFDTESEDPRIKQLMQQIEQLQGELGQKIPQQLLDAQVRKIDAEVAALQSKNKLAEAQAVKTGTDAAFAAMQAGEVIAAVPQVAPIADAIMQSAGYTPPTPGGVDPNFPTPNTAAASLAPPEGLDPVTSDEVTGGVPGDTSPNTPATAGTGARQGIETQESDSVGLANGGLVGYRDEYGFVGVANKKDALSSSMIQRDLSAGIFDRFGAPQAQAQAGFDAMDAKTAAQNSALAARQGIAWDGTGSLPDEAAGILGYADGGLIQGPGTPTSDSIPAMNVDTGEPLAVSTQEYAIPPEVVSALGQDFFEALIARYHTPVEGQPAIHTGAAPVGLESGQMIIPADVVAALGVDFFDALVKQYGQA